MTSISEQVLELAFNNVLHPRDAHGHWIRKIGPSGVLPQSQRFGGGLGQSTIEAQRRAKIEEVSRARVLRARGLGPESIREQMEVERVRAEGKAAMKARQQLKKDIAAVVHLPTGSPKDGVIPWTPIGELRKKQRANRRAALQTWTVDEQGQIIRHAHPGVHGQTDRPWMPPSASPGHWVFIRSGNQEVTEPQVGDKARMSLGAAGNQVGTVISVAGGHAVIDSGDDGMRYLVDWRNGGRVVHVVPLSQAVPASRMSLMNQALGPPLKWRSLPDGTRVARDPHPPNGSLAPWLVHTPAGGEFHVSDRDYKRMFPSPRSPSPAGDYIAPGTKQLILPGMPETVGKYGHTSAPVRNLQKEISGGALKAGEAHLPEDDRGQQASTAVVTLPDGYKVIYKTGQPKERADREELSYYVSQAIDAKAPAVARVPGTESDLVEDFVPGVTGNRYLNEAEDWDEAKYEMEETSEGEQIGLLDRLIGNSDRNIGNWIVDPVTSSPVPIDHGLAYFDGEDPENENFDSWLSTTDGLPADYVNEMRGKLEALEPEFDRLGRAAWYANMMRALGSLPVNMEYASISAQALEMGWRYDPAEARDNHGRWTRGGPDYATPDPARLNVKKNKSKINYPRPQDHPFFKAHQVSPANVIKSYQASTDQEKAQGMRWYADAHLLAAKLADGDARKGAILLAAYSPQSSWPVDMMNAARAAHENRALGHHDGMISGDMQANAQEALDGATVEEALQAPKTLAFARLIEHGGDAPDDTKGQVVIDRHAMSVAMGERLPDNVDLIVGKTRYHEYVADQYREAARQLTEAGTPIAPHQLQAITWLHQQAANQAGNLVQAADKASPENARARGRRNALRNAWAKWTEYAGVQGLPLNPGTTSLAQVVEDWFEAVELAVWDHELRDRHGRWTRGGVARVASDLASGIASHKKLGDGKQGKTEILTLNNGTKVVQKTLLDWEGHPARDLADSEELAAAVAQAVDGTGAPAVHRSGPKQVTMAFSKGVLAERYLADRNVDPENPYDAVPGLFASPRGLRIGMLDYLIDNPDRHSHNYLMDGDKPVPIDNSSAYGTNGYHPGKPGPDGQLGTVSPFTRALFANPNGIPAGEVTSMGARLAAMAGDFASRDRGMWHAETMVRWANYLAARRTAAGLANGITGQVLELRFDPAELRDTRGRWTKFGGVNDAADTASKNREGFSVSVRTGEPPPSGYMVAQVDHTHVYPEGILDDHAKLTRAIDDMIMAEKGSFAGKQAYLGGWVHDGKLWLEPSDNLASKNEAIAAGRARNQISIFDLQTYEEIQTGGSGGGRITEHASQDPGSGAIGLSRAARGRAAGGGSRAGHGDSIGDQVLLGWHFNPLESRDKTGKWAHLNIWSDAGRPGKETSPSGTPRLDPGDKTDAEYGLLHNAVRDFMGKARVPALLGGGHEAWTGKVTIFRQEDNKDLAGSLDWHGNLIVSDTVARGIQEMMAHQFRPVTEPDSPEVLLHELIHGTIGGSEGRINARRSSFGIKTPYREEYYEGEKAYQVPAVGHIEEGFTELGTIHHAPEFFKAMGIGDRKTNVVPSDFIPVLPFSKTPHLTLNDLALRAQDPVNIENGTAWGHYGWQTRMAQDWVQQVAQDEGHSDMRMSTPGYARTRELADEINRESTARKVNTMARQVVRAALKNSPEAPLLNDDTAMDQVLSSTSKAIIDAWAGQEAAMDAHRAAVRVAHQTAQTVAMDRRAA